MAQLYCVVFLSVRLQCFVFSKSVMGKISNFYKWGNATIIIVIKFVIAIYVSICVKYISMYSFCLKDVPLFLKPSVHSGPHMQHLQGEEKRRIQNRSLRENEISKRFFNANEVHTLKQEIWLQKVSVIFLSVLKL